MSRGNIIRSWLMSHVILRMGPLLPIHQKTTERSSEALIRANVWKLRMIMEAKTIERPRKKAARIIKQIEAHGGFPLACGCVLSASAMEMRRLMELTSPETILEIANSLECPKCR
jgi:hypothetical protein